MSFAKVIPKFLLRKGRVGEEFETPEDGGAEGVMSAYDEAEDLSLLA